VCLSVCVCFFLRCVFCVCVCVFVCVFGVFGVLVCVCVCVCVRLKINKPLKIPTRSTHEFLSRTRD